MSSVALGLLFPLLDAESIHSARATCTEWRDIIGSLGASRCSCPYCGSGIRARIEYVASHEYLSAAQETQERVVVSFVLPAVSARWVASVHDDSNAGGTFDHSSSGSSSFTDDDSRKLLDAARNAVKEYERSLPGDDGGGPENTDEEVMFVAEDDPLLAIIDYDVDIGEMSEDITVDVFGECRRTFRFRVMEWEETVTAPAAIESLRTLLLSVLPRRVAKEHDKRATEEERHNESDSDETETPKRRRKD